jgi:putative ABC transport system permease protein
MAGWTSPRPYAEPPNEEARPVSGSPKGSRSPARCRYLPGGGGGVACASGGAGVSLALAARLARRDLRGGLAGFRVFLACLALGVAAIAAVGSVREAIDAGLRREAATMLGGDAELRLTYRFAEPAERAFLDRQGTVSEAVDFRSMAVVGEGDAAKRGLTQVKGVDALWPLIGTAELDPPMPLAEALAASDGLPGAVMDPVLATLLDLSPGATFRLGTQEFRLMALLTREPDSAAGGFALGPRTLVRTQDLAQSGLLSPGTLFETKYRLRLPPGAEPDRIEAAARDVIGGGAFRWSDARNGVPGMERFVDQLSAFLVLTGLAGLAVGGVGISAAVQSHLAEKRASIATLKVLGASRGTVFLTWGLQVAALAAVGILIGLVLGVVAPLLALPLVEARLGVPAGPAFQPAALAEAALYGALAAALFTLWPLAQTEAVRAAALWRDASLRRGRWPRRRWVAATLALLAALVAAAAWLTGAAELTLWAAAALTGAFVALLLVAALVRLAARRAKGVLRGVTPLRLALGAIGGPGGDATAVVLSLGLGLAVLATVGQIDANLRGAIARDLPDIAPSFFVVDIQPDQLDGFRARALATEGVTKVDTAPMLRGVITRINGRPAEEVAGDHWVIRGDRGVTYAETPPAGTTITAGAWWPAGYSGPNQMSFSAEEAAEIGLKLGDSVTVNILGRDIDATVTSFREVKFETAGIGFVMALNPAALAGAPHSHIATIYGAPEADTILMRDLAGAYPNVTLIRVRDAIDRVTEILGAIAGAVTFGALATLVTGAIVLVGAAAAGERQRTWEAAVLKTLGASRRGILLNFALRSLILGAAAGLVAVAAGGLAGWGVSRFVMETRYTFELGSALLIVAGGVAVTLVTGLAFALRPLSVPPARVLRASE